jgi:hypothetical protein
VISPSLSGHNLDVTRRGAWSGLIAEMVVVAAPTSGGAKVIFGPHRAAGTNPSQQPDFVPPRFPTTDAGKTNLAL